MADSGHPDSRMHPNPLSNAGTMGGAVDPLGLSTVPEVPRSSPDSHGKDSYRRPSKSQSFLTSRNPSLESSLNHSYHEKVMEDSPRRLRHTGPTQVSPRSRHRSEALNVPLQNGNGHYKEEPFPNGTTTRKDRRNGFRNTLRRMFSRRSRGSAKDRISMPASTPYPRHV